MINTYKNGRVAKEGDFVAIDGQVVGTLKFLHSPRTPEQEKTANELGLTQQVQVVFHCPLDMLLHKDDKDIKT